MTDPRPSIGILWMVGAVMFFALLDATAKHLAQTWPVPMLVWARYMVHFLLMAIFLAPSMRTKLIAARRPGALALRALMLLGTTVFAISGLAIMPLAEATAFLFVTPLVVTLLAASLLREKVTAGRWLAVIAGLAGALLIARPGGALSTRGVVLMSLAATCYAIYQIQTRQLSSSENAVAMVFYTALVGAAIMTLATPLFWGGPTPGAGEALMICSMGVYGGTGHLFMTRAFRHAPASTLSPFSYLQLVWALLLGWLIFEHLPDGPSLLGMVVIAASSISIALGEHFSCAAANAERP